MAQVAVDAAGGQQTHNVQGLAVCLGVLHGLDIDGVFKEFAVCDLLAHLGQDLEHHTACADIGVAHLGVAHLPLGQTHVQPGGGQGGAGVLGKEPVKIGLFGLGYGVAGRGSRQTVAVQNDKNSFFAH